MKATPALSLQSVSKSFGPIEVLHGVDLDLYSGEVHALIGENGAGKSTAMKILAGYQPASSGTIKLDGDTVTFASLHEGEQAGIVMIHQEFNLAEQLTVEQNIFLGRELKKGVLLDKDKMRRLSREYLDRVNCKVSVETPVSQLSNSDKQMVEIAKALSRQAKILIMDEPTAVLTRSETEVLFKQVKALRESGTAILFTSHKLDEVSDIADQVTIMRDGSVVQHGPGHTYTEDEMAISMVGRDVSDLFPTKPEPEHHRTFALKVRGLSVPGYSENIDLDLAPGEILGIGGLIGSGRTETMEGLAGLRRSHMQSLEIYEKHVQVRRPSDALNHGLCYLTEDRKLRGLLLDSGLRVNLTLQNLHKYGRVLVDRSAEEKALTNAIAEFDIRAGSREMKVGNLSGGNQQKLLLAKVMLSEPKILIVDEPTRGIDIGTKQQIYVFLRRLATDGHSIIVVSSEMQELIGLADRVIVMRMGRVAGTLSGQQVCEDEIVRLAMGLVQPSEHQTPTLEAI